MNSQLLFELSITLAVMAIIFSIYALTRPKYKPPMFSFIKAIRQLENAPFPVYYASLGREGKWYGHALYPIPSEDSYKQKTTYLYQLTVEEKKRLLRHYNDLRPDDLIVELYPHMTRVVEDIKKAKQEILNKKGA